MVIVNGESAYEHAAHSAGIAGITSAADTVTVFHTKVAQACYNHTGGSPRLTDHVQEAPAVQEAPTMPEAKLC